MQDWEKIEQPASSPSGDSGRTWYCLLQAGYGVIFLTRTGTVQPYSGGLSEGELHDRILDLLLPDGQVGPTERRSTC